MFVTRVSVPPKPSIVCHAQVGLVTCHLPCHTLNARLCATSCMISVRKWLQAPESVYVMRRSSGHEASRSTTAATSCLPGGGGRSFDWVEIGGGGAGRGAFVQPTHRWTLSMPPPSNQLEVRSVPSLPSAPCLCDDDPGGLVLGPRAGAEELPDLGVRLQNGLPPAILLIGWVWFGFVCFECVYVWACTRVCMCECMSSGVRVV